jgi:hypothetical protein
VGERLAGFANPHAALKVSLRNLEKTRQCRLGDKISSEVETNAAGWLYLIVFSQEGKASASAQPSLDEAEWQAASLVIETISRFTP